MTKDIKHVHGNTKIKLAKFLSKKFASVLFIILKFSFPKQKAHLMKYLYQGPPMHHGKLIINLCIFNK